MLKLALEGACFVGPYYTCSYTVASSPGIIPSFAEINTAKLGLGLFMGGFRGGGVQGVATPPQMARVTV